MLKLFARANQILSLERLLLLIEQGQIEQVKINGERAHTNRAYGKLTRTM